MRAKPPITFSASLMPGIPNRAYSNVIEFTSISSQLVLTMTVWFRQY